MRRVWPAVAATLLFAAAPAAGQDRFVHRRGGSPPLQVEKVSVTPEALIVRTRDRGVDREERIFWDRVAAIDPDVDGGLEAGVPRSLELGENLWRGVRRLQRFDARLARDAFETAWAMNPPVPGVLSSAILEGLVRSGIDLGETDRVLTEAMLLGELTLAGHRSDRFDGPGFPASVVDEATGLVPEVPPVAEDADPIALRSRRRDAPILSDQSELRRDLWSRLIERSGPPEVADRGLDEGTRLLLELARLDADDPQIRSAARRRLLDRIDEAPAWRVAWIRWFAGSSLIDHAGDDADQTLLGVLDLVHVLALEHAAPVAIRRAALRHAADALSRIDRDDDAAALRAILAFESPDRSAPESIP